MESSEIHQLAEEEEEDQEKTHIKDLIQEVKTSSRQQREKVVQSTHFVASMKSTTQFFHISHQFHKLN